MKDKNIEVKVKKKRGRKPKKKNPNEVKVPKKRGRKTKKKNPNEVKVLKKRGRKPQNKSYGFNKDKKVSDPIVDENIIIHLPLKNINEELSKVGNLLNYTPETHPPLPLNNDQNLSFIKESPKKEQKIDKHSHEKQIEKDKQNIQFEKVIHDENWFTGKPKTLKKYKNERENELRNLESELKENTLLPTLTQYKENKEWPESTQIACWWCSCQFKTRPCGLPVSYKDGTYNLIGNFCSPECAASYNFNNINNTEIWEKYALLNMMYTNVYKNKIKLAPPRNTLKKFGGCLTIEQFRANNSNNCEFKVILPPIKSVIPQIEYSNNNKGFSSETNNKSTYKLKRKTPFNKNTLEKCMMIMKK